MSYLPYNLITRKLASDSLTDSQRWKFKFELSGSYYGQPNGTYFSVVKPTVELAGKALSLSYNPATEDDEAVIISRLPEPDENGEINSEDIPDTLPGYLINLIGEFKIGDEIIGTTDAIAMGTELITETGYWEPNRGWNTSLNEPVAGEYQAYVLDLQGVSPGQVEPLKQSLESTQANIEAENYDALTKQGLVGDTLYATMLSYMALNNLQDTIQSRSAGMISYRGPSYGQFKTKVTPQYWYGVPRNVELGGLTMDVDLMMNYQVEESNDDEKFLAYNQAQGARMSAMEHLVPEHKMAGAILHSDAARRVRYMDVSNEMFSTEENPANGISAVKALQIAGAEGQRIWTITSENVDIAIPNLNLPDDIISDIRNSAAAGLEITAHEQPVNFYGSSQVGYIILDPATGAGAYKIGGGENGGSIKVGALTKAQMLWGLIEGILLKNKFIKALLAIDGFKSYWVSIFEVVGKVASIIEKCDDGALAGGIKTALVMAVFIASFALITAYVATLSLTFVGGLLAGWAAGIIIDGISTGLLC